MILSIVFPRLQRAQWDRVDEEFKDIEYEVIVQPDFHEAVRKAKGKFILFLEEDSAFEQGHLRKSLELFISNPSYRKLAMVSSAVDFDDVPSSKRFTYENSSISTEDIWGDSAYPVSIGYIYGAIIRSSALKGVVLPAKRNAIYLSTHISDLFWSNGLRIEINPSSIYYAPAGSPVSMDKTYRFRADSLAVKTWHKEFIS